MADTSRAFLVLVATSLARYPSTLPRTAGVAAVNRASTAMASHRPIRHSPRLRRPEENTNRATGTEKARDASKNGTRTPSGLMGSVEDLS
ncbi:hypothetical protein GALMADRAFT_148824 [Galerina marginata CBS 339.88]|uniref:Uncharacterized protein n=1 Tax=Galerina marginata (strain CBS 339.88) TaxID=685588 RepID=A0A067SBX0_GALM3|nr:hypothetical protein GALMADRAFT_148824 [Galerina marginata CBS 339.88]